MSVLIKVFFVVFYGAYTVGQTSPNIQSFASARGAAYKVYSIIDYVSNTALHPKSTHDSFIHLFPTRKLSVSVTEHAPLYSGTLGDRFDKANNSVRNEMLDFGPIGAPAVGINFASHLVDITQLWL